MPMRCIKKTTLIIAVLVYSSGFFYTQGIYIKQKSRHTSAYAVLDIRSSQSAADVYINNVHRGTTPLIIEDILTGYYNLRIEKKGFYTEYAEYLFESANTYKITAELKQITGTLHIRVNETDTDLYINGTKNGPPILCFYLGAGPKVDNPADGCDRHVTVPEGEHEIEIKKFGKKNAVSKAYVFRETQVYLDFSLEDADFELTSFSAEKNAFNPYNPGKQGMCRFDFSVSAPGEGILEIYGADSRLVYRGALQTFTAENGSCTWNGTDQNGTIVKQGIYTAYLQVRGNENAEFTQSEPLSVAVDTTLSVPLNLFSGSGLSAGFVPSMRLMPKGNLYSACTGGADFTLNTGFKTASAFLGFAYAPLNFLELSCTAGTEIKEARTSPFIVQGCLKAVRKSGIFGYGALLGGTYSSAKTSNIFTEGILHTGILLAADYGPLCIGVSEQAYFGSAGGALHPFNGNLKTGISGSFQKGFCAVHLSAALYSPFSSNDIQGFGSIQAGSDLCILIPKSLWMPGAGIYYMRNKNGEQGLSFRIGAVLYH